MHLKVCDYSIPKLIFTLSDADMLGYDFGINIIPLQQFAKTFDMNIAADENNIYIEYISSSPNQNCSRSGQYFATSIAKPRVLTSSFEKPASLFIAICSANWVPSI